MVIYAGLCSYFAVHMAVRLQTTEYRGVEHKVLHRSSLLESCVEEPHDQLDLVPETANLS
jgi:hypothetical protein